MGRRSIKFDKDQFNKMANDIAEIVAEVKGLTTLVENTINEIGQNWNSTGGQIATNKLREFKDGTLTPFNQNIDTKSENLKAAGLQLVAIDQTSF